MSDIVVEIIKCETPQVMLLDICKNCQRAKVKKGDETEMFQPKQKMFSGWECDGYMHKDQGSLF